MFTKVLSQLCLFGALPPSILPMLVSVRTKVRVVVCACACACSRSSSSSRLETGWG